MMTRRDFAVNASTFVAAALAAIATPLRLFAGPAKIAGKIAKASAMSDADIDRLASNSSWRCLEKFISVWNIPYPRVEEIRNRLADARRWDSPSGDKKWEKERVARIENELADAERLRAEHPDRYTIGLGQRIDVEVDRRLSVASLDEWRLHTAEWRLLEWLFDAWAPTWIDYVGDHGSEYLFDDWATWTHNGLRCAEIASHADLIEVIADLAAIRNNLQREKRTVPEISETAHEAMEQTGFTAAFDAVFDEASVMDGMTEEVIDVLWNIVEECVAVSGVTDFEPVIVSLRTSAIEMLAELNAGKEGAGDENEEEGTEEDAVAAA